MFYQPHIWNLNSYLNFTYFSKLNSQDTGNFVARLAALFLLT